MTKISPAFKHKSDSYPKEWCGKIPKIIRMTKIVKSDLPFPPLLVAKYGEQYEVWVNQNGAVSAILDDGKKLGVKPDEFEILEMCVGSVKV